MGGHGSAVWHSAPTGYATELGHNITTANENHLIDNSFFYLYIYILFLVLSSLEQKRESWLFVLYSGFFVAHFQ